MRPWHLISLERQVREIKSKITSLDFGKADFGLCTDSLGRLKWKTALEGKGAQDSWFNIQRRPPQSTNQSVAVLKKSSKYGRKPVWINKELWIKLKYREINRK